MCPAPCIELDTGSILLHTGIQQQDWRSIGSLVQSGWLRVHTGGAILAPNRTMPRSAKKRLLHVSLNNDSKRQEVPPCLLITHGPAPGRDILFSLLHATAWGRFRTRAARRSESGPRSPLRCAWPGHSTAGRHPPTNWPAKTMDIGHSMSPARSPATSTNMSSSTARTKPGASTPMRKM